MSSPIRSLVFIFVFYLLLPGFPQANAVSNIIINEVAWMGTLTSANDEWLELFNQADEARNVDGWLLKAADDSPKISLTGTIPAKGFWLLERTDDSSVVNINADQIYTGALNNKGETLELYDNSGNLIDSIDCLAGWPAGDNETKQTMSRFNLNQWKSSKTPGGTPKTANTFKTEIAEAEPRSTPLPDTSEARLQTTEAEPQTTEVQPQSNNELAAAGKQAAQKPAFFLLVAGVLAVFSGIIILVLKKTLK